MMAHPPTHSAITAFRSFSAVETTNLFTVKDEVESPSLSNPTTRARFEFESGRGNEGTKILMVEWEDDDSTRSVAGDWLISWEGKSTVLPAAEKSKNGTGTANTDVNRLYFLLPPGVPVPAQIKLEHRPKDSTQTAVIWKTNPLPAIYPPELGASARTAGKKGVLHTLWGKKRLQELQKEIDMESKHNAEIVGLEMAMMEKEWIEQNFGVSAKPISISIPTGHDQGSNTPPLSPASPRSPGGGRLAEKLKGLKLGTSAADLSKGEGAFHNPLSPEGSDVAVSSFASFKQGLSALAAKPAQPPQQLQQQTSQPAVAPRRVAAHAPPAFIQQQQQQSSMSGMGSLNAFAGGMVPSHLREDDDNEDGLFALPMSPRSPDMSKSPFTFAAADTVKYA